MANDFDNPLQALIVMGKIIEDVDVFGVKVRMRVLNSGQRKDILEETGHLDPVTRMHQIKVGTLARAVMSINGNRLDYTPKSKDDPITLEKTVQQNKELMMQAQQPVLDHLYERYSELELKQSQQIEELKKKSLKPGQEASGGSESPQGSIGS